MSNHTEITSLIKDNTVADTIQKDNSVKELYMNELRNKNLYSQFEIDKKIKEQKIKHRTIVFYCIGIISLVLLACFLYGLYCLQYGITAEHSVFAENKFSLSLLLFLAVIPTIWISIIIRGLYNVKDINSREEKENNFPVKELLETINKNI